jgi:hypothetical protein
MIIEDPQIFICSFCDNPIEVYSLVSWNTFNFKLYSDGKQIPSPPCNTISKCPHCDQIIWISDLIEIEDKGKIEKLGQSVKNSLIPSLQDFIDYQRNIKELSIRHETFIRIKIWWSFNDRIRKGGSLFEISTDEDFWNENTLRLIDILKLDSSSNVIQIAELFRNLGHFDICREIILKSSVKKGIMNSFLDQCDSGNKLVFELI